MEIPATSRTPEVLFSPGSCSIKGECYPEDITEFSAPIMDHLRVGLEESDSYKVEIELYYFNSSSAKFLFDFFDFLEGASEGGRKITINWRYRSDDDTMQEAGEDFEEDLSHCCYNLVVI